MLGGDGRRDIALLQLLILGRTPQTFHRTGGSEFGCPVPTGRQQGLHQPGELGRNIGIGLVQARQGFGQHVAGVVALLCEKRPALTQAEAEAVLEGTALYLAPGSRTILGSSGLEETVSWGADATGAGLVDAAAALAALP